MSKAEKVVERLGKLIESRSRFGMRIVYTPRDFRRCARIVKDSTSGKYVLEDWFQEQWSAVSSFTQLGSEWKGDGKRLRPSDYDCMVYSFIGRKDDKADCCTGLTSDGKLCYDHRWYPFADLMTVELDADSVGGSTGDSTGDSVDSDSTGDDNADAASSKRKRRGMECPPRKKQKTGSLMDSFFDYCLQKCNADWQKVFVTLSNAGVSLTDIARLCKNYQ